MSELYALYVIDNSDGEGDRCWMFAKKNQDGLFVSETGRPVIEYVGDEVLREVNLNCNRTPLHDHAGEMLKLLRTVANEDFSRSRVRKQAKLLINKIEGE